MADRRDRYIRDSGLPANDDSLITIRGSESESSDPEDNPVAPFIFNPTTPAPSPSPPGPLNPFAMDAANNANPNANQGQVRPQQIANIPLFDGERGEGFVNWIETLENARDAYDWPVDSLVGIAKSRGGPKIVEWLRGKRLQGTNYTVWNTDAGMKKALMSRFGPKHTSATAILAVSELKQRSTESCADFMDRVLLAVDRTHYNLTPAQKQANGYQEVFTSAAIMHFGAGVRPDIGKVILAQAVPPATIENMLSAAEAVEAEQAKKSVPGASALAVTEATENDQTTTSANNFDFSQLQTQLAELTEVVAAIASKQPFDFSKIRCYRCNKYGHFQNKCPNQQRSNPGPNRRFPRQTRRQGRNAFRGSSRAQYPIEPEHEESQDPEDEEQEDQDPWISGNY